MEFSTVSQNSTPSPAGSSHSTPATVVPWVVPRSASSRAAPEIVRSTRVAVGSQQLAVSATRGQRMWLLCSDVLPWL